MRRMRTSEPAAPSLAELPFHILLALGDGPSHGYAIGQQIEEQSGGRLDPTTGALYQALRRLTEEGLVTPVDAPDGTAARPTMPESSVTSTSTVGFPRESRICRPRMLVMVLTRHSYASLYGPLRRIAQGLARSAEQERPSLQPSPSGRGGTSLV